MSASGMPGDVRHGKGQETPCKLSAPAVARRERMLADLQVHLDRRIRRRRAARVVGAGAGLAVLMGVVAAGAMWPWREAGAGVGAGTDGRASDRIASAGGVQVEGNRSGAAPAPVAMRTVVVDVVSNRPGVLDRTLIKPRALGAIHRMSDAELMAALRSEGVEDGLIRVNGKLELARDVAASVQNDASADPMSLEDRSRPARAAG